MNVRKAEYVHIYTAQTPSLPVRKPAWTWNMLFHHRRQQYKQIKESCIH
jgi:hypothetical protein